MFKKPRGTIDIFGDNSNIFFKLVSLLEGISNNFGYSRVETPIFEDAKLFNRKNDDTSDMVTKEMYDFYDKSNRKLVLRPEGTAPIIRFVAEEKILQKEKSPLKYFYIGPMFRYERPQNGRQRQFWQYGIESISIENIFDEIEIILLANSIVEKLRIKNTILKLNYIGRFTTREKWIIELSNYFEKHKDKLTEQSIKRIHINPLRILDDKIDSKKDVVINSPKIDIHLDLNEKKYIETFKSILNDNNITFEWDFHLVRGLDYYTGIVFEIISNFNSLNEHTIIGGGRYEKLFSEIGGIDVPCFGFAQGLERTIALLEKKSLKNFEKSTDVYFANLCQDNIESFKIVNSLRKSGYSVKTFYEVNKLKNHFKYSEKYNPKVILIFGENESKKSKIIIKNQLNKEEKIVDINNIFNEIKDIIKE